MSELLKLQALIERYDEKKITELVRGSRYYRFIKQLDKVMKTGGQESNENLMELVAGTSENGNENIEDLPETVEQFEESQEKTEKSEFAQDIQSTVHLTFTKKDQEGKLDDIIDSFVRAIIKNKAIDEIRKDKRLHNYIQSFWEADANSEFTARRTGVDRSPEYLEAMLEKRERNRVLRRNILKLTDEAQKIVALLTLLDLGPKEIAEIWPEPITKERIAQIKQSMRRHLHYLLTHDRQYRELRIKE